MDIKSSSFPGISILLLRLPIRHISVKNIPDNDVWPVLRLNKNAGNVKPYQANTQQDQTSQAPHRNHDGNPTVQNVTSQTADNKGYAHQKRYEENRQSQKKTP